MPLTFNDPFRRPCPLTACLSHVPQLAHFPPGNPIQMGESDELTSGPVLPIASSRDYYTGTNQLACMDESPASLACEWSMIGFNRASHGPELVRLIGMAVCVVGRCRSSLPTGRGIADQRHRLTTTKSCCLDAEASHSWSAYLIAGPRCGRR